MALIVGGTTVTGTQVLDATKLSGNLPALNGSALTNIAAMSTAPTTGTWTPAVSGGSITNASGKYQKFGQIVYFQMNYQWSSSTPLPSSHPQSKIFFYWSGLPFTALNIGTDWFLGQVTYAGIGGDKMNGQYAGYVDQNTDRVIYVKDQSTANALSNYDVNDNSATFQNNDAGDIDYNSNAYNWLSGWYVSAS